MNKGTQQMRPIHATEVVVVRVYGDIKSFSFETTWEEVFIDNPFLEVNREEMEENMNVRYSCTLDETCSVFRKILYHL